MCFVSKPISCLHRCGILAINISLPNAHWTISWWAKNHWLATRGTWFRHLIDIFTPFKAIHTTRYSTIIIKSYQKSIFKYLRCVRNIIVVQVIIHCIITLKSKKNNKRNMLFIERDVKLVPMFLNAPYQRQWQKFLIFSFKREKFLFNDWLDDDSNIDMKKLDANWCRFLLDFIQTFETSFFRFKPIAVYLM